MTIVFRNDGNCKMHFVDWTGSGQHGHLLYDPFEEEALLFGGNHHICPELKKAIQGVFLIAEQKKRIEESTKVLLDPLYVNDLLEELKAPINLFIGYRRLEVCSHGA
jgi:hypothetical protein